MKENDPIKDNSNVAGVELCENQKMLRSPIEKNPTHGNELQQNPSHAHEPAIRSTIQGSSPNHFQLQKLTT